jgi:plastocyanin
MYGQQRGNGPGYGTGYGQMYGQSSYEPESPYSSEDRTLGRLLTASGVPNEVGRIRWPIGLSILGDAATQEQRDQIEALFQIAAAESMVGPVNANVSRQLTRNLQELRHLLLKDKEERFRMASRTYEEAERFLAKLATAEKRLAAGLESRAPALVAEPGKQVEVNLQDHSFQPRTLTVSAGTTVTWTNRGRHRHTVTSDPGLWDSGPLNFGKAYAHTFDRPGTYPYHCELHPQQMRGMIEVKEKAGQSSK